MMDVSTAPDSSFSPQAQEERDTHPLLFSSGILAGRSKIMRDIHRMVDAVCQSPLPVLITGPRGCGKRALARAIHDHSLRSDHPFVSVNVAALGRDYSAKLFGKIELPTRLARVGLGSLALHDVADLGPTSQLIFEELLETGEYVTPHGRRREELKARIITITSANLPERVARGQFRADLLHRLGALTFTLPPLSSRLEDIPDLVPFLLAGMADKGLRQCRFTPEALKALQDYHWPGNVRELDTVLRTLTLMATDRTVERPLVRHVLERQGERAPPPGHSGPCGGKASTGSTLCESVALHLDAYFKTHEDTLPPQGLYARVLAEVERPLIRKCLEVCQGNQIRAAELLGLNRNTLRKKIRELGLTVERGVFSSTGPAFAPSVSAEAEKEAARKPAGGTTRETIRETIRETTKQAAKETAKETAKEIVKEAVKEAAKEAAKNPAHAARQAARSSRARTRSRGAR